MNTLNLELIECMKKHQVYLTIALDDDRQDTLAYTLCDNTSGEPFAVLTEVSYNEPIERIAQELIDQIDSNF